MKTKHEDNYMSEHLGVIFSSSPRKFMGMVQLAMGDMKHALPAWTAKGG
jgi:hypothetical protein